MPSSLEGFDVLSKKLADLGDKLGYKTLRSAALKATTPVLREMRQKIPVGNLVHRTYRGRLIAPGFAKRSLRRITKLDRSAGKVSVLIGVKKEAYYAIQFIDEGITVTQRRYKKKGSRRREKKLIRPYTIKGSHWYKNVFVKNREKMENELKKQLTQQIEKVARG